MKTPQRNTGWLIVTKNGHPLLYDGRFPMFWHRTVARQAFSPWMNKAGCQIVRASVVVSPLAANGENT